MPFSGLQIQLDLVLIALGPVDDGGDPLAGDAVFGVVAEEIDVAVQVALLLVHGAQQLVGGPVKNMEVIYSGPVSKRDTKRIGIFAVIGVLNKIIGEKANIINAVSIAKSKGITYKESKLDDSSTYDAVEIKLEGTDGKITCVKGTVFAGVPRLTKLNGYTFEMPLQSDIFVARYKDQPGVIGAVGKAFGDNDVNIGQMVVARNEPNGTAMMVLTVDHDIKDDVAKKVIDAAGFEKAKFIAL